MLQILLLAILTALTIAVVVSIALSLPNTPSALA
jgi:hypothetical protein